MGGRMEDKGFSDWFKLSRVYFRGSLFSFKGEIRKGNYVLKVSFFY